jgi:probable HAF family extracellular repeat protein
MVAPPIRAQDFDGLGDIPGGVIESEAAAISGDGSIVIGLSGAPAGREGVYWTADDGLVSIGILPSRDDCFPMAISDDGTTIVGYCETTATGDREAFRWSEVTEMLRMGFLPGGGHQSEALATSADGAVIVGGSDSSRDLQAFRWNVSDDLLGLNQPPEIWQSESTAVSDNGAVIAGWMTTAFGTEVFRWTAGDGIVALGDLSGGKLDGRATAMSADGSVIVGTGTRDIGPEAFRWTEATGIVGLGYLPEAGLNPRSEALAVSANGEVIVGVATGILGEDLASVWDWRGLRNLRTVLITEFGMDLSGWTLTKATGVSNDGRIVVGTGVNPKGFTEGWRATMIDPLDQPTCGWGLGLGFFACSMLGIASLKICARRRPRA